MFRKRFAVANLKAAHAFGREDYREVIRLLEADVDRHGDDPLAIWKIAYSYMRLGEYDKAVDWGSRGLAMDPRNPDLLQLLAACYSSQGDHDRAYQCVCRALEEPANDPWKLGWFTRAVFRLFSLHPRFRRVRPDRVQRGLDKVAQDQNDWRGRAAEYKAWYETTHRGQGR